MRAGLLLGCVSSEGVATKEWKGAILNAEDLSYSPRFAFWISWQTRVAGEGRSRDTAAAEQNRTRHSRSCARD
jgi:hypothetical protein